MHFVFILIDVTLSFYEEPKLVYKILGLVMFILNCKFSTVSVDFEFKIIDEHIFRFADKFVVIFRKNYHRWESPLSSLLFDFNSLNYIWELAAEPAGEISLNFQTVHTLWAGENFPWYRKSKARKVIPPFSIRALIEQSKRLA